MGTPCVLISANGFQNQKENSMRPRILRLVVALILICATNSAAHPPTAFVMDDAKNLYFTYSRGPPGNWPPMGN